MTVTPSRFHWKFKPLAALDQAPPVQNTWYTVLDTVPKARIYSVIGKQVNGEAELKAIDPRVTVDGVTLTQSGSTLANNTIRSFYISPVADSAAAATDGNYNHFGFYIATHAKSLKVEMRLTSAPGTNQHLYGYVRYAQLEAI